MADDKELEGPYDKDNGLCSNDHPLNSFGRCEELNKGNCKAPEPKSE